MTRTVRIFAVAFASLLAVLSPGGVALAGHPVPAPDAGVAQAEHVVLVPDGVVVPAARDGQARAQIPFGASEGPVRVEGAIDTAEPAADAKLDIWFFGWHRVGEWRFSADARECRSAFGHEGCVELDVNKEQKYAEVKIEVDKKVVGTGRFQW